MERNADKNTKWVKVNIYQDQASKIDEFLKDVKLCSQLGFLSKSNFVQNVVRKEIERIEEMKKLSNNKPNAPVKQVKIESGSKEQSKEESLISDPSFDQFGMGNVVRLIDSKKTIQSEAKFLVQKAELEKQIKEKERELQDLREKTEKKQDTEQKYLQELEELKRLNELKNQELENLAAKFNEIQTEFYKKQKSEDQVLKELEEVKKVAKEKERAEKQRLAELEEIKMRLKEKEELEKQRLEELEQLRIAKQELEAYKEKMELEEFQKAEQELSNAKLELENIEHEIEKTQDEMKAASLQENFDEAARLKKRINTLRNDKNNAEKTIKELQDIVEEKRIQLGEKINNINKIKSFSKNNKFEKSLKHDSIDSQTIGHKKSIKVPPPPKMPPVVSPKSMPTKIEMKGEEKRIVNSLFGDSDEDIETINQSEQIIAKANELLKEGFELENTMNYKDAAFRFTTVATMLIDFMKKAKLTSEERRNLEEKIKGYQMYAESLKRRDNH